jgi:lauroyl/myristoyl acyltransferase
MTEHGRSELGARVADLGYLAGWSAVKYLPERAARSVFAAAAEAAYRRNGSSVRRLRDNLGRAVPELTSTELEDLTRRGLQSYGRYWCEVFRLPRWSTQEIEDRLVTHDLDRLHEYVDRGRGVVAVMAHIGNWDHLAAWSIVHGLRVTTVVERLQPEDLFRRFLAFREGMGLEVVPNVGDDRLGDKLQAQLRSGGLVALVADRDLASSGVEVDFLGGRARMPPGPAILARRTGAVVMPVWSYYDERRTHLEVGVELVAPEGLSVRDSVQHVTQQFADGLGAVVRRHPEDWHMMQPVWLEDLPEGTTS